ncbi:unnamed protein product [Arctogadus glacialis]
MRIGAQWGPPRYITRSPRLCIHPGEGGEGEGTSSEDTVSPTYPLALTSSSVGKMRRVDPGSRSERLFLLQQQQPGFNARRITCLISSTSVGYYPEE